MQAATELFKLLLVALPAATAAAAQSQGNPSLEDCIMQLLVPVAVAAVAPAHDSPPEALAALVLQLIPRLAAGPSAPAFRAALTALSPASMQRLQVRVGCPSSHCQIQHLRDGHYKPEHTDWLPIELILRCAALPNMCVILLQSCILLLL